MYVIDRYYLWRFRSFEADAELLSSAERAERRRLAFLHKIRQNRNTSALSMALRWYHCYGCCSDRRLRERVHEAGECGLVIRIWRWSWVINTFTRLKHLELGDIEFHKGHAYHQHCLDGKEPLKIASWPWQIRLSPFLFNNMSTSPPPNSKPNNKSKSITSFIILDRID